MPRSSSSGPESNELTDVAGPSLLDAFELAQQPVRVAPSLARRVQARPAVESLDLDPGVLAEHPAPCNGLAVARLGEGVLVVRRAFLRRVVRGVEELELPVLQRASELAQLVLVP